MATSAKPCNKWGKNELLAFNIKVVQSDSIQAFFGTSLPPPTVSPVILENEREPDNPATSLSKTEIDFFGYLDMALEIKPGEESAANNFIPFVVKMMQYNEGRRLIFVGMELSFEMCGQRIDAVPDVCVLEWEKKATVAKYFLLVVQENKCHLPAVAADPAPQLIAQAIAAFSDTNRGLRAAGIQPLELKTFAGMTMEGTTPTFYKIPVTAELVKSVATAQQPLTATIVERFVVPVPFPAGLDNNGMMPLANRQITFQCLEAFRQLLVSVDS